MRIVADVRFVMKNDGKKWMQCRYYKNLYVDASGSLGMMQGSLTDWEDVPLCENDFDEEVTVVKEGEV